MPDQKADQDDLRSPQTPWITHAFDLQPPDQTRSRCDVLIVGCGITGALVAERLTREGRNVIIIDREKPAQGSTAASTAMLLWEIDRPMTELTDLYGFERASRAYRASLSAARGLVQLVGAHRLPCDLRTRNALYLADDRPRIPLATEMSLRSRAELPGYLLDHLALLNRFGLSRAGAILSPDAADADPVALTQNLLRLSLARGARFITAEATRFESSAKGVSVELDREREVKAQHVVLATGYAMPDIVPATIQQAASTWAIATAPQPQNLWPEGVLIWEATENYHYARTTTDGRIIFGGEDDRTLISEAEREAATPAKTRRLQDRLKALWPRATGDIDYRWSGIFDSTKDGLPLIGPVPNAHNIYAAYGYGGNGITFSYLAAALIAKRIAGGSSPLFDDFAIDRDGC